MGKEGKIDELKGQEEKLKELKEKADSLKALRIKVDDLSKEKTRIVVAIDGIEKTIENDSAELEENLKQEGILLPVTEDTKRSSKKDWSWKWKIGDIELNQYLRAEEHDGVFWLDVDFNKKTIGVISADESSKEANKTKSALIDPIGNSQEYMDLLSEIDGFLKKKEEKEESGKIQEQIKKLRKIFSPDTEK